jgi:Carbohydrate binding domain
MLRSWMGLTLALLLGGSVCARLAGAAVEPGEMVRDGGFESGDTGGVGRNWANESYGTASVQFDLSTDKVQYGKYCQHFLVQDRKDDGYAQICQIGMNVRKGQQYSIVLWMRGNLSVPVLVGFRKHGPPYTFYVKQEVRVTPAWQRYTITGVASDSDENAGLFLGYCGSGDLWIDNVSARPTPNTPPATDHPASP